MVQLDGIRQKVFLDRYALKDEKGDLIEHTPEEMWARVAKGIAATEKKKDRPKWEKAFYDVMQDFKFVPGGRILSGAGTGYQVTYFNCFVIPSPKDSRHGILESLGQLVEIQARSGGVGLNLSSLRPKGARVKKVNGTSSGPVNWATLFSVATHDIVQQGGSRRGATMLMLWDWHPDIEEFITVKQDLTKINGANLSVCVSDSFMEAVKKDGDWDLLYPDLDDTHYDEEWDGDIIEWKKKGYKTVTYKTIKARELWNLICDAAWRSAEPGLHFLERSNTRSNTWYFEKLIATNPCGEQPLSGWAVCNLGAMNLAAYVKDADLSQDRAGWFDYEAFGRDTKVAMRLLDNVIDQTYYFYKQNEQVAKDIRRTGLGIMGLADALIKMKIAYGSDESMPVIRKIFETLRDNAYEASSDIAKEKGSFPKFVTEKYLEGYHIKALPKNIRKKIAEQGMRNAVLLTIAPTGTTSLVSGVSSGVEPVYECSS
jgi:ribonucleoside-diphosphate reductase alpha chain